MEQLPGAALLVDERDRVLHANAAGRALLEGRAVGRPLPVDDMTSTRIESRAEPPISLVLWRSAAGMPSSMPRVASAWGLSPREREVLGLLVRGWANAAIAGELGCAEKTVEQHVSSIFRKSGAAGRAELVFLVWTG
jgi:DNA-binding NarL/FixJ family response regulator